jgi:hypothetical protein
MFSFNSQIQKPEKKVDTIEYSIQITTDDYAQFCFMQNAARECVDGKHTEDSELILTDSLKEYLKSSPVYSVKADDVCMPTFTSSSCKNCPNHPNNGGSGNCTCTLGCVPTTYTTCSTNTTAAVMEG